MIFSTSCDFGKSDVLVNLANDLTRFAHQAVEQGSSLDDLERGVFTRLLEMGHAVVDLFLNAQGDGDLGESVNTEEGIVLQRSPVAMERSWRTILGEHALKAYVYSQGSKKKIPLRPIDARRNLPEGKASYLLQEFSQLFCVEKAFGVGARQFEAVFQQTLSVDVLEDINRAVGEQADRFLDALPMPPAAEEGAIRVATADGKGGALGARRCPQSTRLRPERTAWQSADGHAGLRVYGGSLRAHPEQMVAALFRDLTVPQPPDRPKAFGQHYRGYFAQPGQDGEDPLPSVYRTWSWIGQEVRSRR